jgi:hypothetical protein
MFLPLMDHLLICSAIPYLLMPLFLGLGGMLWLCLAISSDLNVFPMTSPSIYNAERAI